MRYLLFDRVTSIEPGRRIEGVKCVSLTEECFRGHFDRKSVFPGSLLIEAMIQLLAWCAMAKHEFEASLVLTVLDDVQVPTDLAPGCRIEMVGELMGTNPKGSMGRVWAEVESSIDSANGVLFTTDYVRDALVRKIIDLPLDRFLVLPCGVDLDEFHPDRAGEAAARHALDEPYVFCYLYHYLLDLEAGQRAIDLPEAEDVRIFAVTLSDEAISDTRSAAAEPD